MKITIIIEGRTEKAFLPVFRELLRDRLKGNMPRIQPHTYNGRIPKGEELKRVVSNHLTGQMASDHVIALTDVYTGTSPPDFTDALDAKRKMRAWVGDEQRFHPHAAQYDFEAWLLPFWATIQRLAKHNKSAPSGLPETINHDRPPADRIAEIFELGKCRDSYIKPRDGLRIMRDSDLLVSINACPELKSLSNTILTVCGADSIP